MARFFFHLQNANGVARDEEGSELPDLSAAKRLAVESVRELVAEAIRRNSADLIPERLLIVDEDGRELSHVEPKAVLPDRLGR